MTSVYDLVASQVERVPEATAVIVGDRRTSYRELDRMAAGFARGLTQPRGGLVGVCLGRDERMVAGLLAVWRTGCGYVPLDPAMPVPRLAGMVRQAGVRQVLTTRELAPTVAATGAQPVLVDGADDDGEETPSRAGDGVAYVLFTSGSTGTPKGVVIEHSSVLALLKWMARTIDPAHLRTGLATASLSFDASVHQMFGPLSTGGCVVLADDILALPSLPARDEVTMISAPPSALAALLERPLPRGVRRVNVGAEAVTRPLVDRLYAQPGVETVVNLYGPTECTVFCVTHAIGRDETGAPPIGTAVADCELTVRDADDRVVDDGTPGELWVAGPLVGRGYLGAPELTAGRFVEDPASPGGRRYRTGDLVRRVDGLLHYLGRLDDQVKVRGFRVEFGEVESALAAHPGVRHAVAVAPADTDGTRVLHAYAEAATAGAIQPPDETALRDHLRERLPHYLVPARILVMENLPRNTNGKVDRAALPSIPFGKDTAGAGRSTYEEPRDAAEAQVAAIIADVLDLPRVGRTDRFDDLGGHSLSAARVVARVRVELGAAVKLGDFLADPTAAGLARRLEGSGSPIPPPTRLPGVTKVPLTDVQRQLWTSRRISGFPGATTEAFAIGIAGRVGSAALTDALNALVVRHEALRTVVREDEYGLTGEVLAAVPVPFTEHDARDMTEAEIRTVVDRAARQTFASDQHAPLLRAALLRTAEDAATLVIAVDHLAFDGWSGGILRDELAAHLADAGGPIAEPAVQLGDVARWEEQLFAASAPADQAFWTEELAGAQPPYGMTRTPRGGLPKYRGKRLVRPLRAETVEAVRRLGASTGLSDFAVHLAALDVLLAHWTGSRDVLVGVSAARRDLVELDRVVGPLIAVLPVRVRWEPEQSFRTVAGLAARARNRTLAHTDLSTSALSDAARAAGVERLAGVPLTPVALSMQPSGVRVSVRAGETELRSLGELDTGVSRYEATFFVNDTASGVEVQLCYDVERFDEAAAGALLDGFIQVLTEGTAAPDRACSAIALPAPPRAEALPQPVTERKRLEPATVVEQFLAETWERLLAVENVAASDSLFELGGTSLTAIRVVREIWEALGVEVAVHTIFELPVLADLAAEVERRALALLDAEEAETE
ncbi:amino acid adenylation domain-containing protein [Streptomyces sp. NBC_01571]|uniref:amino acid adenylation domain-containing protein n=1 Tax=Streptomyces sp. NBC_01571 TaxID=2975883 RepID=UPI002254F9AF|nr:amino acid adenylation domain-containing protein [Streptomyces sp. NBC_01571]MCX4580497.1 amino acid adenylation domain-containing protein [Streptomyces sp. NBC_01571]